MVKMNGHLCHVKNVNFMIDSNLEMLIFGATEWTSIGVIFATVVRFAKFFRSGHANTLVVVMVQFGEVSLRNEFLMGRRKIEPRKIRIL